MGGMRAGAQDDGLGLGEFLDGGHAEFASESALAVAAKGEFGETVHEAVPPHGAGADGAGEAQGAVMVAGPDACGQAVESVVGDGRGLVRRRRA